MNLLTEKKQKKLEKIFENGCKNFEPKKEYFINGSDQDISYCVECAEKEVKRLQKKTLKK